MNSNTTQTIKDDFLDLVAQISTSNLEIAQHLMNGLNARIQSLHHLSLRCWDTEACTILNYIYYREQQELTQRTHRWQSIYQSKNPDQIKHFLIDYYTHLKKIGTEVNSFESIKREQSNPYLHASAQTMLNKIDESTTRIQNETLQTISNGIDNVLNLKSSLNLTGSFKDEISSVYKKTWWKYYALFLIQILIIGGATVLAAYFALNTDYSSADFWKITAMKASIGLPLLLVWGFLNSEFRIVRMEFMKMKHLLSLVNGGATAIPQMVNESSTAKHDALSKIADSFVDLNQTLAIVDKQAGRGSELDVKLLIDLADKLANRNIQR